MQKQVLQRNAIAFWMDDFIRYASLSFFIGVLPFIIPFFRQIVHPDLTSRQKFLILKRNPANQWAETMMRKEESTC
jgi:hypothetical protein